MCDSLETSEHNKSVALEWGECMYIAYSVVFILSTVQLEQRFVVAPQKRFTSGAR